MAEDQQLDDRPRRIDLAGLEAEFRTARETVMVVVEPFAAGEKRDEPEIGRGVVEVLVTDRMASSAQAMPTGPSQVTISAHSTTVPIPRPRRPRLNNVRSHQSSVMSRA